MGLFRYLFDPDVQAQKLQIEQAKKADEFRATLPERMRRLHAARAANNPKAFEQEAAMLQADLIGSGLMSAKEGFLDVLDRESKQGLGTAIQQNTARQADGTPLPFDITRAGAIAGEAARGGQTAALPQIMQSLQSPAAIRNVEATAAYSEQRPQLEREQEQGLMTRFTQGQEGENFRQERALKLQETLGRLGFDEAMQRQIMQIAASDRHNAASVGVQREGIAAANSRAAAELASREKMNEQDNLARLLSSSGSGGTEVVSDPPMAEADAAGNVKRWLEMGVPMEEVRQRAARMGYDLPSDPEISSGIKLPWGQTLGGGSVDPETIALIRRPQTRTTTKTPLPGNPAQPSAQLKQLDPATAKQFLAQAGGDKNKARELAKAAGYSF